MNNNKILIGLIGLIPFIISYINNFFIYGLKSYIKPINYIKITELVYLFIGLIPFSYYNNKGIIKNSLKYNIKPIKITDLTIIKKEIDKYSFSRKSFTTSALNHSNNILVGGLEI